MFGTVLLTALFTLTTADNASSVRRWDFGTEEASPLKLHGDIQRDQAGPRPPEFPDFPKNNTAVRIKGKGGFISINDPGAQSHFDFTNGDEITIEAWVNLTNIRDNQPRYIIGKGRTGSPKFLRDNQNWSLRVVGAQGEARLSFLFATKRRADGKHWHRWTSKEGFPVGTGWHHIAIAYRFGDPKSIRGWVNGQSTTGTWDLGGTTKMPPVVDNDEVRIGYHFEGLLDAIAIHRTLLKDKEVASRFRRIGKERVVKFQPEIMPVFQKIPAGQVLVQLNAGLPTHTRWLYEGESWPKESARWHGDYFLLPRIFAQFDAWGIRTGWKAPVLLRIAADVELPAGRSRFMFRARALGRLWVDGKVIARTKPVTKRPPDGEEPIIPVAIPPFHGLRAHGYNMQEVFGEATINPKPNRQTRRCRVVLELVVGGRNQRTESGEVCVALQTADEKSFELLGADTHRLTLEDKSIVPELKRIEELLSKFDDQRRHQASASQDNYWNQRHQAAVEWAEKHPPAAVRLQLAGHPIDAFIISKIEHAKEIASKTDAKQADHFYNKILPILRDHCFRCHGEKDKGGLKLNSRQAILQAGDSEIPAVIPGDIRGSELLNRIRTEDEDLRMPPTEKGISKHQIQLLEKWVKEGAIWPAQPLNDSDVELSPVIGDVKFLRRVFLDTVGIPPTAHQAKAFLSDTRPDKRARLIKYLLNDDKSVDHWMSFWMDILAENPSLLNASLNSTGPFRWFLYDSLKDNKPLDRMVYELLMLRGGAAEGGSAGFGQAAENDAPLAAKGHIVASAFLGIELQCARCHDSPYHSTTQSDLYSLAAMFNRKPLTVLVTSRVPATFFEKQNSRESLIQVTLKPNQPVKPEWPFAEATGVADGKYIDRLMQNPTDSRERLATLITVPHNQRFSRVLVNRIWKRLIGAGLVEPANDWEGKSASHSQLLDWLAHELITHAYNSRHIVQLILTSQTYQRMAVGTNLDASATMRFFNSPDRRRLSAEQIVDSLHHATGHPINVEELTFVHDGRRPLGSRQTLGRPRRAWMFGDLKNERDRPSLSLPKARTVADVLEAFGWTGARQMPITDRESGPNVLQPGILANGTLSIMLTRASHRSELAELAVNTQSAESLVKSLFLRILSRYPNPSELKGFTEELRVGFDSRLVPAEKIARIVPLPRLPQVTWFNHVRPKANEIQMEIERRVQSGPPADPRLESSWREIYEDAVWSLINHREFVWIP